MSKDGLYPRSTPFDLGTTAHLPEGWPVRKTQIAGTHINHLRNQLRELAPCEPGIYAMLNADDEIIYVGKAKDLRKRLFCYFRSGCRDRKARKIAARARAVIWEVLPSEFTALLRELELIRRWRPTWNVQGQPLRRRHAYLCLGHRPAPHFTLTRKLPREPVALYGPLPMSHKSRDAARWLNDAFGLRDCPPGTIEFFPTENPLFPLSPPAGCLRLELGACVGPCIAGISRRSYHQRVRQARTFLDGPDRSLMDELAQRMNAAAAECRFEAAALLRDKIAILTWLTDRLDALRKAQRELSFVYPIVGRDGRTLWYLIHAARVVGCIARPCDSATGRVAVEALKLAFGPNNAEPLLSAYEPIDAVALTLSWFRKSPRTRRNVITPKAALTLAQNLANATCAGDDPAAASA
jgi:excinuclease ABC subunit C